jgi:hypothetical protein
MFLISYCLPTIHWRNKPWLDNRGTQRNVSCLFLSVHQPMKGTLWDGNTVALYTGTGSLSYIYHLTRTRTDLRNECVTSCRHSSWDGEPRHVDQLENTRNVWNPIKQLSEKMPVTYFRWRLRNIWDGMANNLCSWVPSHRTIVLPS